MVDIDTPRHPVRAGAEWLVENFAFLAGGGALIGLGIGVDELGAPNELSVPIGFISVWPLGLAARDTFHSVRCWAFRQQRIRAEHARQQVEDEERRRTVEVPAERMRRAPAGELDAGRPVVIEGQVVTAAPVSQLTAADGDRS